MVQLDRQENSCSLYLPSSDLKRGILKRRKVDPELRQSSSRIQPKGTTSRTPFGRTRPLTNCRTRVLSLLPFTTSPSRFLQRPEEVRRNVDLRQSRVRVPSGLRTYRSTSTRKELRSPGRAPWGKSGGSTPYGPPPAPPPRQVRSRQETSSPTGTLLSSGVGTSTPYLPVRTTSLTPAVWLSWRKAVVSLGERGPWTRVTSKGRRGLE